jgi:hypothetical protein
MNTKGFFGYGRCPHCEAFLKEKDLVKNVCWSCDTLLDTKKSTSEDILKFIQNGRCPYCSALIKEKDIENNICWSCYKVLDTEKAKLANILSSIESTFDIKNELYNKKTMIYNLKKVDINNFYEFFLSKYRKVSIQTFVNKDMNLHQKYIFLKKYDDKRSKIYDSIKKDLEKLVKRDKK